MDKYTHVDPGQDVGFLFKMLTDKIHKRADANLRKAGLTYSQFRVLASIVRHGGSMTQRGIERDLRVSHPTVVGLVSRLEESGFVECRMDERDRRNKIVALTQKSVTIGDSIEQARKKNEILLLEGVTPGEQQTLYRVLRKILHNLEKAELSGDRGETD